MASDETIIVFVDENGQHSEFVINGNLMNQQLTDAAGNEIVLQLDGQNLHNGAANLVPVYKVPIQAEFDPNTFEDESLKVLMGQQFHSNLMEEDPPEMKARRISTLGGFKRYLPYSPDTSDKIDHSPDQYVCKTSKDPEEIPVKEEPEVVLAPMSPVPPVSQTRKHISTLNFNKDLLLKKDKKSYSFSSYNEEPINLNGMHADSEIDSNIVDDSILDEKNFDTTKEPNYYEDATIDELSIDLSSQQIPTEPVDPNLPYTCDVCFSSFKLSISLEMHKLCHSESYLSTLKRKPLSIPKYFECPKCDFTCPLKCTIKQHASEVHDCKFLFVCNLCKFAGLSSKEYSDHLQSSNHKDRELMKKREKKQESRPCLCHLCNFRATNKYVLKRHMLTHQTDTAYPCHLCSYKGKTKLYLKKHMITHEKAQNYKCTLCSYVSTSPYGLTRHVKLMHAQRQDRYKCRECPLKFPEMCKLRIHSMIVHGNSHSLFCRYCSFSCMDKKEYKSHLEVHYGSNLYMCDKCDFSCRSNALLKRHLLRHTNIKAHKCPICSRRFHESSDLKRHVINHSNEKPFKCELCDYACKFRNTLTLHMKVHSDVKAYTCEHCSYSTKYAQNLKKHMVVHDDRKPFKCNMCPYSSGLKSSLKKHVDRIHEFDII